MQAKKIVNYLETILEILSVEEVQYIHDIRPSRRKLWLNSMNSQLKRRRFMKKMASKAPLNLARHWTKRNSLITTEDVICIL